MFKVSEKIVMYSAMDRLFNDATKSDDISVVLAIDDFGFYVRTKFEKSLDELTDDELKVASANFISVLRNRITDIVEFARKDN